MPGHGPWFNEFERALSNGQSYGRATETATEAMRNRKTLEDKADDARKREREEGPTSPYLRRAPRTLDQARAELERKP